MRTDDHVAELVLLGIIALGLIILLGLDLRDGEVGLDTAALLLVLREIISTVKERWQQRSFDRMGAQLGAAQPPGPIEARVTNSAEEPVPTEPVK